MHALNCAVKCYSWGKRGLDSKVAVLKQSLDTSFQLNPSESYAELWMGTHPSGPSTLSDPAQTALKTHLGGTELPYLFKVLSVNQALSIQAHPDKSLAAELHARDPQNYPDANHKPEMLVALTRFEALCGFRRPSEIAAHLRALPQLAHLCGADHVTRFNSLVGPLAPVAEFGHADADAECPDELKQALKGCFAHLMRQSDSEVKVAIDDLCAAIDSKVPPPVDSRLLLVFKQLSEQYPGDVGCFGVFLLNHVTLEPFEAVFLRANVPHAYLRGDGVECMACSDNVVRAGLTPKFKDVDTLVRMLDYSMASIRRNLVPTRQLPAPYPFVYEYETPEDIRKDFVVQRVHFSKSFLIKDSFSEAMHLPVIATASILIVVANEVSESELYAFTLGRDDGDKRQFALASGKVYLIDANQKVFLHIANKMEFDLRANDTESRIEFLAYRAYYSQ